MMGISDPDNTPFPRNASPTYDSLKTKAVVDHTGGSSPIDRALSDLHMNLGDTHQLLNELEVKIFPILAPNLNTTPQNPDTASSESDNSRIHDALREENVTVVLLLERLRNLIGRVQL